MQNYVHNKLYFVLFAVTGNANFNMSRTSFSFFGMTQPYAAMPVIQDQSNNAKGFTSRILWYFPEPVFAKFEDTMLTPEEITLTQEFEEELGITSFNLYPPFLIIPNLPELHKQEGQYPKTFHQELL